MASFINPFYNNDKNKNPVMETGVSGSLYKPGINIGKYLLLGAAALLTTASVMAGEVTPPASVHSATYEAEAVSHVHRSQDLGYLGKNIIVNANVFQKNVSNDYLANESLREQTNNSYPTIGGECQVTVTFSKDGRAPFLGFTEDLYKITAPQNAAQQEILREAVELHEASHCEFNHFANPIMVQGNPELQNKMNYYFSYGSTSGDGVSGIRSTLNETFADTYALIQMMKIHGDNADMQWLFKSLASQREEMTLKNGRKDSLESHSSQFAIEELMRPEVKDIIAHTNNPEELKQLALKISNYSVQKLYNTYSKLGEKAYGLDVINNGMTWALYDALAAEKSNIDPVHNPRGIVNNGEKSFALDCLPELLKEVHAKGVTGADITFDKTGPSFHLNDKKSKIIENVVDDVLTKKLMENNRTLRLNEYHVSQDYHHYISENTPQYLGDYASSDMSVAEFATKVVNIRSNFKTDSMTDSTLASVTEKTSIMNKIAQLRENSFKSASALDNSSALTIK